jgi:hypothetical protein
MPAVTTTAQKLPTTTAANTVHVNSTSPKPAAVKNAATPEATKPTDDRPWPLWWDGGRGFGPELIAMVPWDAKIKEGSTIGPEKDKTPGVLNADGTWSILEGNWSDEYVMTQNRAVAAHQDGADVGIQGRKYLAIDIDCEDEKLVQES